MTANFSISEGSAASTSASLGRQGESLHQQSASSDDSLGPSIPTTLNPRGPSPAARVTAASEGVQHNHRIVIIGGGAGGLPLACTLGDKLARKLAAEITLVDQFA